MTATLTQSPRATRQPGTTRKLWKTGAVAGVSAAVATSGTKALLALTHVVAAAIVIPALASRLSD